MNELPNDYLEIAEAAYVSEYKISLKFSDGLTRVMDFEPFLSRAQNPGLKQYRQPARFKKFKLENGNLMWGDYEMVFPVIDLHWGEI
jgi:hypothetical protein